LLGPPPFPGDESFAHAVDIPPSAFAAGVIDMPGAPAGTVGSKLGQTIQKIETKLQG
jgi:hypothetical protein